MKKILVLLITIVVALITTGVVTGCGLEGDGSVHEHKYADPYTCHDRTCTVESCGHVERATTAHKLADKFTCHDRTCADCGEVVKATTAHKFKDEFTCHDRTCADCGQVEKATTEHSWGEWVIVREPSCVEKGVKMRECDDCGETETVDLPAKGHTYADKFTCHDRTCTVEDCGHVEKATTAHNFGEWVTIKEPTCTEEGLRERICSVCGDKETEKLATEHSFGDDGVCTNCHKDVKEFFITPQTDTATVTATAKKGFYSISSTQPGSVYAVISGDILTELKKLGYTELSFTATNPAPWPADNSNKVKPIKVAADNTANLWTEETAIAFYGWQEFWDANRQVEFKIDLNEYAGRDIYIYTEHADVYPLEIVVSEFIKIDYEDRSEWLFASADDNGEVTYFEGKGWVIKNKGTGGWYCQISGKIMKHYIDQGCTRMVITYANNLEGDANTDEGNFVKTHSRLIPLNATGGNDWKYQDAYTHLINALPEGNGGYMFTVDLTDTTHDFTKDNYFYFENKDADAKAVTRAYISDISFQKGEPVVQEDKSGWIIGSASDNGAVRYIEGKGWVMSPANGSGEFWCLISGSVIQEKIAAGYTKMTIVYANNLEGSANTDTGNFINTASRLYPCKAGGGYISDYVSGAISSYCVKNEAGNYEHTVSLTEKGIDFTKDQYIYCLAVDTSGGVVTRGYIADIVFEKGEPVVQEDKSGWIIGSAGDNGAVRYIDGKGWVMSPANGSGEFWCLISGSVIQEKIAAGYTKMTIVYANNLEGSANTDTGNFINTASRLYPCKAGGGYISDYVSGAISSYCVKNEAGNYEHTVSLTDEGIDFTKDQYIYCLAADTSGGVVTRGYIADIVFSE